MKDEVKLSDHDVQVLNEMTEKEVWIGEPQKIKITKEYIKELEQFIRENELYD